MPALAVPASCAVALKEWATVLEAMGKGEQLVLIRKGGLMEPGSGFELISPAFVFYPTFEHQAVHYLRPPYQRYFPACCAARSAGREDAAKRRAPEGSVRVELFGVAVASQQARDVSVIERLSAFHIYNEAFVSQRLKWQPEQPLVIVPVRAYRLPAPQLVPVVPRYAGCKSWVELEQPVSLAGARPILDDAAFASRLAQIQALW